MVSARRIKAASAYVEVLLDKSPVLRNLRSLETDFKRFGAGLAAAGGAIFGASSSLLAPFIASVKLYADYASNIQDVADRTGVAASSLTGLAFAAKQTGADLETLERAIIGQDKLLLQLQSGAKGASQIFEQLGISVARFASLDQESRFKLLVDRLSQVEDSGARAALTMKVFGKAGFNLGPLISGGLKGLDELTSRANELGLSLSNEDIAAGERFGDMIDQVIAAVSGIKNQVGAALVRAFEGPTEAIATYIGGVANFIRQNREMVVATVKVIAVIGGVGAALAGVGLVMAGTGIAIGGIITSLTALFSMGSAVAAVVGFLISPFGLLIAATLAGAVAFFRYSDAGQQMVKFLSGNFSKLMNFTSKVFKGMSKAIAGGDLKLAVDILWSGIELAWLNGKNFLLSATEDIRLRINNSFIDLMYGAQIAVIRGWDAITKTFREFSRLVIDEFAVVTNAAQRNFLEPVSRDLAKFFAWLTTPIGDTAALAQAEASIDATFADKAREREEGFLRGILERERVASEATTARTQALEHEIGRLRAEALLAKEVLTEADRARMAQLEGQIAARTDELAKLLGEANQIELPAFDDFAGKLKGFGIDGKIGQVLGDRLKGNMQAAVDEIKSIVSTSSTAAGRTAGFLAGKQQNPNERLEQLTQQQNVMFREQLGVFRNLEVAD